MGYISMLLFLHFYVYAVMATFIFGKNDPLHFGSLGASLLTLFQVVTLEGWVEVMRIQMVGSAQCGYEGMAHLTAHSQAFPCRCASVFHLVHRHRRDDHSQSFHRCDHE